MQDAGKWYCTIPHTETKDGRSIEFALPQDAGFASVLLLLSAGCATEAAQTPSTSNRMRCTLSLDPCGFQRGGGS